MNEVAYEPHEGFVAPARASAAIWRLIVGFVAAGAIYVALNQLYFNAIYALLGPESNAFHGDLLSGTTAPAMYVLLSSFVFMIVGVGVVARVLHWRSLASLLGPSTLFVPQFWAVLRVLLVLGLVIFLLPPWDMAQEFEQNLPLNRWLMLLPLSLLAVLVQVSAEEIVFRGYVQQQLAARFRSPLVWMVLPAAIFAVGHYLPEQAGDNALLIALWAGLFGILMADLTARSGSLGPAIAVHFANNVSAILIASMPDDLSGLALYLVPFSMQDVEVMREWLVVDFALMLVSWLAARLAIRR